MTFNLMRLIYENLFLATYIGFLCTISLLVLPVIYATAKQYLGWPLAPKENYFSLMTNWNEMVNTERHPKEITCISGIRIISIMAVVIGHFLTQGFQDRIENPKSLVFNVIRQIL